MIENWNEGIKEFIKRANATGIKMLMVGGGAVNYHGYKRHSSDVDFWIELTAQNFNLLLIVFQEMGYEIFRIAFGGKRNETKYFSQVFASNPSFGANNKLFGKQTISKSL